MAINMSQLASRYATASHKVDGSANKSLNQLAQVGVGYVKKSIQNYHAVDTGTMLNSTTADRVDTTTFLIGPTVHYAAFVALGTSRVAARPFHIKAANLLKVKSKYLGFSAEDLGI